jgi:CheY-like chemotaxis protein
MAELTRKTLEVLVVDDSPEVRAVIALCLQHLGHRITPAASADEALACLKGGYFDLVVADLVMPDAGGILAIEEARKRHPTARILIMGDGSGALDTPPPSYLAGICGAHMALLKPFTAGQFLDTLATLMPPPGTATPFRWETGEGDRSEIIG